MKHRNRTPASKVIASGDNSVAIGGEVRRSTIVAGALYQFPFNRRYSLPLGVVALILLAGAVVVITRQVQTISDRPRMTGAGPRLAIAEFRTPDTQNGAGSGASVNDLTQLVQSTLTSQPSVAGAGAEIWAPLQTGQVDGAAAAKQRAQDTDADMIVYGNVRAGADVTTIEPRYYLAPRSLRNDRAVAGDYDLGDVIPSTGNYLTNAVTFRDLQVKLVARTNALLWLLEGIRIYEDGEDFVSAAAALNTANSFQTPEHTSAWQGEKGKEVLYLFLGYAEAKLQHPAVARDWFALASKSPSTRELAQRATLSL